MLRLPTPYPRLELLSNDNLSDLDLYNEARRTVEEDYVVVPQLVPTNVFKETPQDTDWVVQVADAQQRLDRGDCWVCGDATHLADECTLRGGRVAVVGYNAEELIQRADQKQLYFLEGELDPSD